MSEEKIFKCINNKIVEITGEEKQDFLNLRSRIESEELERETIAAQTEACWDKFFSSASMTPEEMDLMKKCLRFN